MQDCVFLDVVVCVDCNCFVVVVNCCVELYVCVFFEYDFVDDGCCVGDEYVFVDCWGCFVQFVDCYGVFLFF